MSKRRCEQDSYQVERIHNRRVNPKTGEYQYEIKWVGYDSLHNTWQPRANLGGMLDIVNLFDSKKEMEDQKLETRKSPSPYALRKGAQRGKPHSPKAADTIVKYCPPKNANKEQSNSSKGVPVPTMAQQPYRWLTDQEIYERLRGCFTVAKNTTEASHKGSPKQPQQPLKHSIPRQPSTALVRAESDAASPEMQSEQGQTSLKRLLDNKATIEQTRYSNGRFMYKLADSDNPEWKAIWATREQFVRLRPETLLNYYVQHLPKTQ